MSKEPARPEHEEWEPSSGFDPDADDEDADYCTCAMPDVADPLAGGICRACGKLS